MDDFGQDSMAEEVLGLFLRRLRTVRTVLGTVHRGRERILEEQVDRTVIGEGGSIDTVVGNAAYFADCGHYLHGNLGGRCSCDAIVCRECLRRCAACGQALCPTCSTSDPETGLTVCYMCSDELGYRRRARMVGLSIASLFLADDDREGKDL